jgi:hypothetical protein
MTPTRVIVWTLLNSSIFREYQTRNYLEAAGFQQEFGGVLTYYIGPHVWADVLSNQ